MNAIEYFRMTCSTGICPVKSQRNTRVDLDISVDFFMFCMNVLVRYAVGGLEICRCDAGVGSLRDTSAKKNEGQTT